MSKRLSKRHPNGCRGTKAERRANARADFNGRLLMAKAGMLWLGVVPKSVALMDHCKARNYGG